MKSNAQFLSLVTALGIAVSASAAPTSSEELKGQQVEPHAAANEGLRKAAQPADVAALRGATPSAHPSQTIEMLLQMQDQPGTGGTATARKAGVPGAGVGAEKAAGARPAMATEADGELKAGLIGLKTTLMGPGDTSERQENRVSYGGGDFPGSSGPRTESRRSPGSEYSLLNLPVIRFIRENRALTVGGAIGLLAAVWLTMNLPSRGRRASRR